MSRAVQQLGAGWARPCLVLLQEAVDVDGVLADRRVWRDVAFSEGAWWCAAGRGLGLQGAAVAARGGGPWN